MILGFLLPAAIFPFASSNKNCFLSAISCDRFNKNSEKQVETKDTSLILNPSTSLVLLFNLYNNTRLEVNDDPDNVVNSKCYSINEIQSLKVVNKSKSLSMLHINACSLSKNFDDLGYLPKYTNKKIDVVAVTETRINRNTSKLCNISLKNYAVGSIPTESSARGTLHCKSLVL